MRYLYMIILFVFINSSVFADGLNSLTLTDAEMQKLKKYFPEEQEHLIWKGDPIKIALPIGKEKRLIFPNNVSVNINNGLNTDQLRVINNDKSLYFTALQNFPSTRIFVTLKETNDVVLIDLIADKNAEEITQYIDIIKAKSLDEKTSLSILNTPDSLNEKEVSYVDLIRFAWQQAYASDKIIENNIIYTRAPMHTQKFVSGLVYGDKVIAFPIASWMSGNRYVTALVLRNKYSHVSRIDVRRELCGAWLAATLYPRSILLENGDKNNDSTMLFLVSRQPFGDTLGVCHGNA